MTIVFESYTAEQSATMRLRRAPRVLLSDRTNAFRLHRAPRVELVSSVTLHATMALRHSAPRMRMTDAATVFLLHRVPQVAVGDGVPVPTATVFALNGPGHGLRASTGVTYYADMELHRQPRVLLSGLGARMVLRKTHAVLLYDGEQRAGGASLLIQQPMMVAHAVPGMTSRRIEGLKLGGLEALDWTMVRGAALGLRQAQARSMLVALEAWQERFGLRDLHAFVWEWLRTEALGLQGDAAQLQGLVIEATDALALLAAGGSWLDAQSLMVAALRLGEQAGFSWTLLAIDALGAGAAGQSALVGRTAATEPVALAGAGGCFGTLTMLAPESLALGDAGGSVAELLAQVTEGLAVLARFQLPDGEYLAWVCHTGARAFTRYRGFPFNSFAELGGRYYGATDTGIYALGGDDDAGAPIEASIRGGLSDLGTGLLKRMQSLYLGYRASGDLVLKVVTTSPEGEKTESWYQLEPRPGQAMHEGRVRVGKGLKSVYWGFELTNVDGADFGLDAISWHPMVLERRV